MPPARPLPVRLLLVASMLTFPARNVAAQGTPSVVAVRAARAPVLDGRDDDAVWQEARPTANFREARPAEDADPDQRTEFRVAYDPEYLYVFVRAWDTHPDSIVHILSRRDVETPSDQVTVMIDPYHDRRSGYEFSVNPADVKVDYALYKDGDEDIAWDGIWDAATRIDSLGWTAEFRIPFSQLRFAPAPEVTFGFTVWRTLQRKTAQFTWPLYRQSVTGLVSQFGELTGLRGLASPKRAEVSPYILTQNEPLAGSGKVDRQERVSVGGDLKYAVAPNFTLNATINPDFGQVEADPSQLNLSAFETFFSEKRPFFVAGAGQFDFRVNCFVVVDCNTGENLFYSRRIGRQPSLSGRYGDASSPVATQILGAAKLTGRLASGLSLGFLDAVTSRELGAQRRTIEPGTNYAVVRASQDYADGKGSVGVMLTGVNRSLDQWTEGVLHRDAYSGGLDARRRFGRFEVSGSLMGSRVAGSAGSIALTQAQSTHYFQRPDDRLAFDSTRTALAGYSTELRFAKVGGQHTTFETGYARRSPGFEVNDIGFLQRANEQTWTNWIAIRFRKPNAVFQSLQWNINWWQYWTLEGLPTARSFNSNVHVQFTNRWWLHVGGTADVGQVYCDRNCTRGGPALKVEPGIYPWLGIQGDTRRMIVPSFWSNFSRSDGGRSHSVSLQPQVAVKVASKFSSTVGVNLLWNTADAQWFGNFAAPGGATHYTFAALDQREVGITWRLNYTFTPTASLQWYANPFVSRGSFSRIRELADPRAASYEARFQPYTDPGVTADPGGFNVQQFRSNAVFRWEYRPGSTLFLVWTQGRQASLDEPGDPSLRRDLGDLFGRRAEDRFLVKMSYWLNR